MTPHLMAIELGPVVQIVAAARKTRDLWFGSHILSEIAKAVAKTVALECESGFSYGPSAFHQHLIAPAPQSPADLDGQSHFVMGDEILVRLPAGVDPRIVSERAKQAAHQKWLEFACEARIRVSNLVNDGVWKSQTSEVFVRGDCGEIVEVYSAWVVLPDELSKDQYQSCVKRVKWLLEGRTACRNFPCGDGKDAGAPKSSLDGRRRSVLRESGNSKKPLRNKRLRLSRGEQLDALGVTKRVWGGSKNYPSTARLAADPWVRGAKAVAPDLLNVLVLECERLARTQGDSDPILGRVEVRLSEFPTYPHYKPFSYEGAVLFATRHREFFAEAKDDDAEDNSKDKDRLKSVLDPLLKKLGEPGPYYAILMADGDHVGRALKECQTVDEHRTFSSRLSQFAAGVRGIVDAHQGALVYAAGEDVVAFLPLDTFLACADKLRTTFRDMLSDHSVKDFPMTLSVGVAIGHFLDALEDIHAAARRMLDETAKEFEGKNALAIQYRSRGGAPIECVLSWGPKHDTVGNVAPRTLPDPKKQFETWVRLLQKGDLPSKIAYEVRHLAESYRRWPIKQANPSDPPETNNTLQQEEKQLLRKAMIADLDRLMSSKSKTAQNEIARLLPGIESVDHVVNLANTIIIAGLIANSQTLSRNISAEEKPE